MGTPQLMELGHDDVQEENSLKELEALQKIFPFAPFATSYGMGWKGLQAVFRKRNADRATNDANDNWPNTISQLGPISLPSYTRGEYSKALWGWPSSQVFIICGSFRAVDCGDFAYFHFGAGHFSGFRFSRHGPIYWPALG
jgi:hypothetical protein